MTRLANPPPNKLVSTLDGQMALSECDTSERKIVAISRHYDWYLGGAGAVMIGDCAQSTSDKETTSCLEKPCTHGRWPVLVSGQQEVLTGK
jgi:hypothetical protein|tara:strand:+ start:1870 stop:2142 length:273 start_codon:yes stop_codon:yes gene_type:complete